MTETVEVAPAEQVEEEYVVRLLFKFDARNPVDAVEKMIAELADNGLRQWHYRVENKEGELFFVTGYGEMRSIDELVLRDDDDEAADESIIRSMDDEDEDDDGADG